ncbi:MAG: hypothetical protein IJ058_05850 [Lachnospiraceae bacterium]|nr:hypothetical protein [Lachnospiraceae bacterium]
MKKLNSFLSLLLTATLILSTPLTTFAAEPIDDEILIESSSDSDSLFIEDAITEEATDISSASSIEANSVPDADISEPELNPDATAEEISNDTCASSNPDEDILYQDELLTVYASDNDETETEEPVSSTSDIISCDALGSSNVTYPANDTEIYNRLMELKNKYPSNTPWGKTKTWEGSIVYMGSKTTTSGKACAAFALTVQDEIFGDAPKYWNSYDATHRPTYNDLHVGDYIGMYNHARILVEKTPTKLTWVGGNEGADYLVDPTNPDDGVVYWDYDWRNNPLNTNHSQSHGKDWDNPAFVLANLDKIITCSPQTFTCSFDTLGGPAVNSVTSDYYGNVTLPTPKWSGHTFNGWFAKKEWAESSELYAAKKIKSNNYSIYQDTTLYASWKEGGSTPEPTQPKLTSLDVGATNINIEKDSKQNIRISALPANADVTIEWSLPYAPSNIIHCEQDKNVVGQNQIGLIVSSFDKVDIEVIRVTATDNNYGNKITKDINVNILEQLIAKSQTCFVGEKIDINKRYLNNKYPASNTSNVYIVQDNGVASFKGGYLTTKKAGKVSILVRGQYNGREYANLDITILPKPVIKFTQAMTYKNQERNIYDCITNISAATLGDARFTHFVSSKPAIASISNEGIITAKAPGTTSITAYIAENGKNGAMKTVTVKASLSVKVPAFAKTSYTMKAGQTLKIAMKNVTAATDAEYTSSDPDLINVSADINAKNGKKTGKIAITAIAYTPPGVTQTVIATIDGQTYTVPVYVVEPALKTSPMTHQLSKSIKVGRTLTVALKNTAFKTADVTWISEDPSIASVTGNKVKGIKAGTTKVYTTAGGIRNEYEITVTP